MRIVKAEKKLCPCCMEEHEVQVVVVQENNVFKGVSVEYNAEYLYCDRTDETYAEEQQISQNDIAMKDAYREKMGLLTSKQIAAIRDAVPGVSIDTVERYQGSQRDVIIYDFGVSRLFQLDFLTASTFVDDQGQVVDRKLNVALTRARRQMLMVGNAHILSHNPLLRQLINNFSTKL